MYRTIDAAFWTDPKIRGLTPDGKFLALYLVTNPHGHVGGIYYLPDDLIRAETGLTGRALDTLWHTLSKLGFARKDQELSVVWVVKMFAYQGRGEKNERAVGRHLASLHNSKLINDFLKVYPGVGKYTQDRVSIGYPAQDESGTPEQEQEQEQEQDCVPSAHARNRIPPPLEIVVAYCRERNNGIDPQAFIDYYERAGWFLKKGVKVKDWQAAVRTWEKNDEKRNEDLFEQHA